MWKFTSMISRDDILSVLSYNPSSGVFIRHTNANRTDLIGLPCGSLRDDGYIRIRIGKKLYMAHRLAWIVSVKDLSHGQDIDHINGDKSDNRICNLRVCNQKENMQNLKSANRNSKTGILGVFLDKKSGKYVAQIKKNGRAVLYKKFTSIKEAASFHREKKRELHEFNTL